MKKMKIKNAINIGKDSLGFIFKIDVYKDKKSYDFRISSLREEKDKNLVRLKENLEKIINVKEEDNRINITLNVNGTVRVLGYIENNKYVENIPLTNTEIRMLSLGSIREGNIFSNDEEIPYVTTDLHTHLTGVLSAKEIYEIAMKVNPKSVEFEIDTLVYAKVLEENTTLDRNKKYTLYELNKIKGFKEKLIDKMEIKPYKQITFTDMDVIYDIRGPFFASSDPKLFEAYILKMGERYKANNVKYVEVAASSKMFRYTNQSEFDNKHKILSKALEKTKEKYGVEINFLIANPRSKVLQDELNQYLSILVKNIKYPYIAGIDLLGHEKNSNKLFSYTFASVTRMSALHNLSYFTIRSHAGETREYKENVKDFLMGIKKELEYMKEKEGIEERYIPDIRIGHGIYGIDEETMSLMKELNVKVEINASSNLALNNIYDLRQIPIRRYIDRGIQVVLGTDGMGIYINDNRQESLIAYNLGVTKEELEEIKEFEDEYVRNKLNETNKRKQITVLYYKTYTSKIYEIAEINKEEIIINIQKVETQLDNKKLTFICGMEKKQEDEWILKEDIIKIIGRVIKSNGSIMIYDNNAYINGIIEKVCKKYNIELIKVTSLDENKEGLVYGKDKYEVSKNLSSYFSKQKGEVFVLGGSLFASDLLVNLENDEVEVIYDPRIEGASKEYEERRNNKEEQEDKELIVTNVRKKKIEKRK